MAERVFGRTLLAAAGCHALLLYLGARTDPATAPHRAGRPATALEIEIALEQSPAVPAPQAANKPDAPESRRAAAKQQAQAAPQSPAQALSRSELAALAPSETTLAAPMAESRAESSAEGEPGTGAKGPAPASSAKPLTPDQLGLGARNPFLLSEMRAVDPTLQAEQRLQQNMVQATLDHDQKRSMGVEGPVTLALTQAAMGLVPPRSVARFLAVTDDGGVVRHLTVLSPTAGSSQWTTVASRALATLSKSRLRAPAGKRLQLLIEVTSKVQLPAGGDPERSSKGLGLTFDLSNVGATARQVVRARLIRQTVL